MKNQMPGYPVSNNTTMQRKKCIKQVFLWISVLSEDAMKEKSQYYSYLRIIYNHQNKKKVRVYTFSNWYNLDFFLLLIY